MKTKSKKKPLPAAVKAWVRALRSGKYKQGQDALRQGNKFCCLGVACDLAVKAKVIDKPVKFNGFDDDYYYYDHETGILSDQMLQELGINPENQWILTDMNDGGKTFKQIANFIEKHYWTHLAANEEN